jgi:hypothetical protein
MIHQRLAAALACTLWLSSPLLDAQEVGRYRDVHLGSSVRTVAGAHGLTAEDATVIHQRPAIIQNMEWRPPRFLADAVETSDPVREIVFSFYNDQLFRIVVSYDRKRTEGLTDADLIDVVAATYGTPTTLAPTKPRTFESPQDADQDAVIARWENAESSVALLRGRSPATVSLIVLSKRLSGLARTADAEAIRLDRAEAPQREVDRLKKEADARRASGETARPANKAAFKP